MFLRGKKGESGSLGNVCNTESSSQDWTHFHSVIILDPLTAREHSNKNFNNLDHRRRNSVQKKRILTYKNSIYCDNLFAVVGPLLTRVFIVASRFS